MIEFLEESLLPHNLLYSFLVILTLLYWVTVFLGLLDFHTIDFDIDVDVDIDVDADVGSHASAGHGVGISVLKFFHVGSMPVMIILSFWFLTMWLIGVLTNHYLGVGGWAMSLTLLVPVAIGSMVIARYITVPFAKVFNSMATEEDNVVLGRPCKILSETSESRLGQAEITTQMAKQLLNVKAISGVLHKGDTALIVEYNSDKNMYLVELYSN